jgi:hypothetical protein
VTNLTGGPEHIYDKVYCGRGEIENPIKKLKLGMELGRTSCSRSWSNHFRVLLTAAAYMLMQEMRLKLARTALAMAQVNRLREQLLTIGCRVVVSVASLSTSRPQFPLSTPGSRRPVLSERGPDRPRLPQDNSTDGHLPGEVFSPANTNRPQSLQLTLKGMISAVQTCQRSETGEDLDQNSVGHLVATDS